MTTQLQEQKQKQETLYTVFNDELCMVDDSRQDPGNLYLIGLDSGTGHKIDKDSIKVLDKFEMTFKDASYVIDWIADNLELTCDEARVIYDIQDKLKKEAKWQASNEENSLVKYVTSYDSIYDRTIVFKHVYNNCNKNFEAQYIGIYGGKPNELCTKYVVLNSDRD